LIAEIEFCNKMMKAANLSFNIKAEVRRFLCRLPLCKRFLLTIEPFLWTDQ